VSWLLVLAAAVVGLSERPAALVGAGGQQAYAEWLAAEAFRLDGRNSEEACAEPGEAGSDWPVIEAPAVFAAEPGFAVEGEPPILHERVSVSGCGRTRVVNLLAWRLKAGGWRAFGLLPGVTLSDAKLQNDATRVALAAASAGTTCPAERTLRFGQARVSVPRTDGGAWTEVWPIALCGQDRTVEVTFTPAATSGATDFRVRPMWTAAGG